MDVTVAEPLPRASSPAGRQSAKEATHARTWVLALTSVASFMVALDALVVSTALSTIRVDFGTTIEALGWTVNAYNLSFAVLLLTGAALGDRFGRRRVLGVGLGLFTAASIGCAVAPNVSWLIAARAVQGAGGAMVMPVALALLSAAFSGSSAERARALGVFSGLTGLALLAGPVVGGAMVEGVSWHWIFWLNVPIGLVTVLLVQSRLSESSAASAPLDRAGLLLASASALAAVWGLSRANVAGWTSPEVLAALVGGLVLGITFVAWERRTPEPMIPMRLFRSRAFAAANAACFLFTGALYAALFFNAQFLQTAQGYEPLAAGVRLLPWTATLFIFAPLGGRLVSRLGERLLIVVGLVMQAFGLAWLARMSAPDLNFVEFAAPLLIAGAGVSLAMPAAQNAVLSSVSPTAIGKASGTYNMLRFLGGAFGIALSGTVFTASGGFGSPQLFTAGFAAALAAAASLSLLGALAGLLVPPRATTV
ncbi:MAG: DHA2 family efflux MFS transporter permease subunit [Chloroflexi bacterium]|nr:DHA2 family efflux MFS transporter permease subunit [Chloroflexota bacterium]